MADPSDRPYRDPSLSVERRVEVLLERLTLEEKVAQLGSYAPSQLFDDGEFDRERAERLLENGIGEDYIDRAFEWASEVTDADLYYNDYGADTINEKSDAIYDHLEGMLDRGVPIDGVGFQLHAIGNQPDPDDIAENLRRFSDLGLDVQITEMDVAYDVDDAPADPLEAQAEYYADVMQACLDAGCDTLVTWGINDSNSWVRGFDNVEERYTTDPLLFDRKTNPKPAYHAVKETLAGDE